MLWCGSIQWCGISVLPIEELDQTFHDRWVCLGLLQNFLGSFLCALPLGTVFHTVCYERLSDLINWCVLTELRTWQIAVTGYFWQAFLVRGARSLYRECFTIGWRLQFNFLYLFKGLNLGHRFAILICLAIQLFGWNFIVMCYVFFILYQWLLLQSFTLIFVSLQLVDFCLSLAIFR